MLVSSANVSEVIALSSFEYDAAAAAAAARPNMALCSLKRRDCFNLPPMQLVNHSPAFFPDRTKTALLLDDNIQHIIHMRCTLVLG